ncbi:DUF2721 domain-containing protein [bacterium]|nr:DUF2721 domain-containing protein [bacterium]
MEAIESLTVFLQTSITPIVLISGVGLLLLSVTNRLARTIDRSRMLAGKLQDRETPDRDKKLRQLDILYTRSRLLRNSIAAITLSILCSSLIIVVLLTMNMFRIDLEIVGKVLFLCSIGAIICSVIYLMIDVTLTLRALDQEIRTLSDPPEIG